MIGWLQGKILEKQAPNLLLNVNGVGYEIQAPMTTFYALEDRETVELYTHFVVREDAQLLYGFATRDERSLFRHLIKVNGVGPKLALAILSGMDVQRVVLCIQTDDVNSLVKIPGIGRKTAERLLIEMRDRLKDWYVDGTAMLAPTTQDKLENNSRFVVQEAESALIALGYKPQDAAKMINAVNTDDAQTAETLIRAALKRMF